ncbi:MAG: hypothetical protein AAF466_07355 [Bacteroidota bacterium]
MLSRKAFLEPYFEQVAQEEGVQLRTTLEKTISKFFTISEMVDRIDGLRTKNLLLHIPYKDYKIQVDYEVGDEQMARFHCDFDNATEMAPFEVRTINPYLRILFPRKNMLKVSSSNNQLKKYIEKKLVDTGLENIARKYQFSPSIFGKHHEGYEVSASFTLSFDRKELVLKPMIQLYKDLIDWVVAMDKNYDSGQQRV